MAGKIDARLAELGLTLPKAAVPQFSYIPFTTHGQLLFVAGQIPQWEGDVRFRGRLGDGVSLEQGQAAAKLCAQNVLAQVRAACDGDLDRVERFLRLGVFVACSPEWVDTPKVANGASDLLTSIFGDAGKHARTTTGAASLPLGVCVEIDAIVALRA
jgi:enamine deaminase RidA (YjgF/YER057c/UK114 family)